MVLIESQGFGTTHGNNYIKSSSSSLRIIAGTPIDMILVTGFGDEAITCILVRIEWMQRCFDGGL